MRIDIPAHERALRYAQALRWVCGHTYAAVLSTHGEAYPHGPFPDLMAAGAEAVYEGQEEGFTPEPGRFWLGALSYDYGCSLQGQPVAGGEGYSFFSPSHVLVWDAGGLNLYSDAPAAAWEAICAQPTGGDDRPAIKERGGTEKLVYEQAVQTILEHLHRGEAYEVNYCRKERVSLAEAADLCQLYESLTARSPMPFQFLYQSPAVRMAGSSPERFLKRSGDTLISQPIKGTVGRGATSVEDDALRNALVQDEKVLAENMMITDLVRNDLARICQPGTVRVEELFGPYTFRRLHQLITTVAGETQETDLSAILRATFPMGSMTGAPKERAMDIIRETEDGPRGYFSGAVGYILPDGDFDLAVVIRTVFVEDDTVTYWAGGAIVWDSQVEQEWAEASLKMEGMRHALGQR